MSQADPSMQNTTPHSTEVRLADAPTTPAGSTPLGDRRAAATVTTFDPLLGTTLAERYQIVRKIGEGGMGAVYEARHTVIGKRVAVKVLLQKFLENQELVARLLQEARLASSIGHQNIVDVTDFGTTSDGRAFVVMEYLEGEALAQLVLRDAPLPIERCLHIVRQVASALVAAHGKGIVHRDIKPENIFLVRRGDQDYVKVVDFGVSKAVHAREEGTDWERLTRTGTVLGTPLYMSPEQARGGEDVDHRADIWATGLMLYECLTGEVPFRAGNYLGVISQVLTQETVPPSQLRPELAIPAAVDRVVMRALDKDRERRYQHMAELESDLERLLAGDATVGLQDPAASTTSAALPASSRLRWPLAVAALLALGAGVAFALVRGEDKSTQPPLRTAPVAPARLAPTPAAPAAVPAKPHPAPTRASAAEPAAEPSRREPRLHRQLPAAAPGAPAEKGKRGKKSKGDDLVAPSPYPGPEPP